MTLVNSFQKCSFLVLLACSSIMEAASSIRGVSIVGTTVPPGFIRPTGKAIQKCPSTHPYPFGDYMRCCQFQRKINNPSLAPDCDGGLVYPSTSNECCFGQYVSCPDTVTGCNTASSIISPIQPECTSEPTILYSDTAWSSLYIADYALTYEKCEVHAGSTYQLFKGNRPNQNFVIDLGCELFIKEFVLRNTRNGHMKDRGTKEFTLEVSLDNISWHMVVSDTLAKVWDIDLCELPLVTFPAFASARYIRFTAVSYYNAGSGLNYITWNLMDS